MTMTQMKHFTVQGQTPVNYDCRPRDTARGSSDRFPQLDEASIDHLFNSFDSLSAERKAKAKAARTHTVPFEPKQRDHAWLTKILSSHHGKSVAA